MNTLDMYTREKVNRIHQEEMRREAHNRYLLRRSSLAIQSKDAVNRGLYRVLAGAALVGLLIAVLVGIVLSI